MVWMKTRHDNNETYCIGLNKVKIKTELLGPIWLSAVCDENQTGQQCDYRTGALYPKNGTELSWSIGLIMVCDEY